MAVIREEAREEVGEEDDDEDFCEVTEEVAGGLVAFARVSCRFVFDGECLRGNATG